MTEVSSSGTFVPSTSRMGTSYFPSIPPKAPKTALSYPRFVLEAPYSALMGVVVDGRVPDRHPVTLRCRERNQVGHTNRWRLPESLGSDLLGNSQAIRSISTPYNETMVHIMTAESPQMSLNLDTSRPYQFRQIEDRPYTLPMSGKWRSVSAVQSGPLVSRSPVTAPSSMPRRKQIDPIKPFTPTTARPGTPKDIFLYHSKRSTTLVGPDVLLRCLDMDWELHRPFLQKSEKLTQLMKGSQDPIIKKYYRSAASETLDNYIKKSNFYSNEYREISNRLSVVEGPGEGEAAKGLDHPVHTSEERVNNVTVISIDIRDPVVTRTALAITLGNLYHDDICVDAGEVAGVLAAASILGFKALVEGCAKLMLKDISHSTVCKYHHVSSKYQQEHIVLACERWLELNLVPCLSNQIHLRELPIGLLQKIIKSNRLFVYNEYSVYRTLVYWLFMQLNPSIQLMPSHATVLSFFNSLPKFTSFLDRDDGQIYAPLFATVRLHGVLDTSDIQDMQIMNVIPQLKMIELLSQHYHALQGGGDMSLMKNFNTGSIRQGFIIDDEPLYHSEVMSLHGFHFELKAVGTREGQYTIYMQRLKPGDPILSFRQCERHTFSMRADREVRYCITVQYLVNGENQFFTTGVFTHKFGLGEKTSKSEVIRLENLKKPIYVMFSVLFPSS